MKRLGKILLMAVPTLFLAAIVWSGVDDGLFGVAKSRVTEIAGLADETAPDSVGEGDVGAVRMSLNRNLYINLRDAAGNERGANVDASNQLAVADSAGNTLLGTIDTDTGNAVTALQIIDDWDSSDHAKTKNVPLVWDSDNAANCAAITASSAQLTLDTDSTHFRACAWGNNAYVLTGSNPTATTTVTTGFSFIIADGQCHDLTTADAKAAIIGTSAAGNVCFISLEAP